MVATPRGDSGAPALPAVGLENMSVPAPAQTLLHWMEAAIVTVLPRKQEVASMNFVHVSVYSLYLVWINFSFGKFTLVVI